MGLVWKQDTDGWYRMLPDTPQDTNAQALANPGTTSPGQTTPPNLGSMDDSMTEGWDTGTSPTLNPGGFTGRVDDGSYGATNPMTGGSPYQRGAGTNSTLGYGPQGANISSPYGYRLNDPARLLSGDPYGFLYQPPAAAAQPGAVNLLGTAQQLSGAGGGTTGGGKMFGGSTGQAFTYNTTPFGSSLQAGRGTPTQGYQGKRPPGDYPSYAEYLTAYKRGEAAGRTGWDPSKGITQLGPADQSEWQREYGVRGGQNIQTILDNAEERAYGGSGPPAPPPAPTMADLEALIAKYGPKNDYEPAPLESTYMQRLKALVDDTGNVLDNDPIFAALRDKGLEGARRKTSKSRYSSTSEKNLIKFAADQAKTYAGDVANLFLKGAGEERLAWSDLEQNKRLGTAQKWSQLRDVVGGAKDIYNMQNDAYLQRLATALDPLTLERLKDARAERSLYWTGR